MLQQLAINYSYNYNVTTSSSSNNAAWLSIGIILFLLALAFYVVFVIALWKLFVKAGRPGWAAIIPIYNYWVIFEISGKPGWWSLTALLSVIPYVGWIVFFVLWILAMLELAKRFNKSTLFAVFGLIIFSIIGYIMLGFGDAKYQAAPAKADPPAPESKAPTPPTPPAAPVAKPPTPAAA